VFRKSAVSTTHQEYPAEKANLADLMCHRQETVTKWYRVMNREKTSVHAAAKLAEVMHSENHGISGDTQETNATVEMPLSDSA